MLVRDYKANKAYLVLLMLHKETPMAFVTCFKGECEGSFRLQITSKINPLF